MEIISEGMPATAPAPQSLPRYAAGTSTRKVAKVAATMGSEHLSNDQVSAMASSLDADAEELLGRDLSGLRMPYLWLDATYGKCRTGSHVASVAVVTAIGCDEDGWRHVLVLDIVDTESYDSWLDFLQALRAPWRTRRRVGHLRRPHRAQARHLGGLPGLRVAEVRGHLIGNCAREAGRGSLSRRAARIAAPVFRAKDADAVRAMHHVYARCWSASASAQPWCSLKRRRRNHIVDIWMQPILSTVTSKANSVRCCSSKKTTSRLNGLAR